MAVQRVGAQSVGPSVASAHAIQGHDVRVSDSTITVVAGGNNHNHNYAHTHIYYYAITDKLKEILEAVSNYRKIQQDTLAKATPGTILWLLECNEFRLFVDLDGTLKILWGSGMPGAGKTVLAAIVINELERLARESDGQICVGYVYLRYSDQEQVTIRGILETLVKQTVERHLDCMALCEEVYSRHIKEGTQPTEDELVALLRLFNGRFKAAFYVFDALDEAPARIQLKIIQKLSSLGARLFITSRPLPALEAKFPTAHTFSIRAQAQDLDLHIAEKISESQDLQDLFDQGDTAFRERLILTVKSKCGGMFLHASLQLEALQSCFTTYDAMQTLEAFPSKVEDVYQQTWSRIVNSESRHHASLAKTALVWVLNAKESMTIDLLRHALATCVETYHYDSARLMPGGTILTACRGLLTVDKESRLVRLVHYTAKEPLERLLSDTFPNPHALLTAICVTHLADCGFQSATFTSWQQTTQVLEADPLLAYAYEAWVFHTQKSSLLSSSATLVLTFISGCSAFPVLISPMVGIHCLGHLKPLHLATWYNLPIFFAGPQAIQDPNIPTACHEFTPLDIACIQGHQLMVQSLLYLPGISVNTLDPWRMTPLMRACRQGHEGIVELFLARPDIEINVGDAEGTALMNASSNGHAGVAKLLLAHPDIDVNQVSQWRGSTALTLAAMNGHAGVVEVLLAFPGIKVNTANKDGNTAIKLAAQHGHEDVICMLLEVPGIDISIAGAVRTWRGLQRHTAMSVAVDKGHHRIVRLLQDFEARRAGV